MKNKCMAMVLGLSLAVGANAVSAQNMNLEATKAYQWIELMLTYNLSDRLRLGGGWHQSYDSKRNNTGIAAFLGTEKFKADPGAVVQVAYFFKPYKNFKKTGEEISSGLGLRYVTEKFTSETTQKTYKGDHVGVFFMLYF